LGYGNSPVTDVQLTQEVRGVVGARQRGDLLGNSLRRQSIRRVAPTAFRVDLDGVAFAVVRNGDPRSPQPLDHLSICQGRFDALGPVTSEPN
jgi:hypothetical protein